MRALLLLATLGVAAPIASISARPSAETLDLVVASTTDTHGRLRGWDYFTDAPDPLHGLSRAATIVDSLRAGAPGRVILVDAGDLLQGNPLTFVAARIDRAGTHPVIAAMNVMKYDAAAVGNHEFNYGMPMLRRAIAEASFPFLAANAVTPAGAPAFPAYRIIERAGVHIGIVGATTPGSMVWDRANLRGQVVLRDIIPDVRRAVGEVRARGADVVIVAMHSGLNEPATYDTVATKLPSENVAARVAREVPGVDLIIYGHTHKQMADTVIGTTMLQQPRNWATSVGVAHLTVVRDGAHWHVAHARGTLIATGGHAEEPALLAATEAKHERTVTYVKTPLGSTAVAWRSDSARVVDEPITDFVLETMREAAHTELASTAVFDLGATLGPGAVTIAQLAKLYPYDNTLMALRITGRQLRDYLEYSARYYGTFGTRERATDLKIPGYNLDVVAGADYAIDVSKPIGSRITTLRVRGRDVRDDDHFSLALNNYRAAGGGGYAMLRGAPILFDRQLDIRQLLIDEVARRGTLRIEDFFHRNWEVVPIAAVGPAYKASALADSTFSRVSTASSSSSPSSLSPSSPSSTSTKTTRVRIVAINDLHGAMDGRVDARGIKRGGAAALATVVAREEASCSGECASLLIDAGDEFQGTPASNLAFGRPIVQIFNVLGVAVSAVGNHEFDWGIDTLRARMREAKYSMLAANVRNADGSAIPWLHGDTIVTRGDVKIGIIGIATPSTPHVTKPSNVVGLEFLDPAPVVDAHARTLRQRGAQMIIVVAHEGAFCDQTGRSACSGEIVDLAQHVTEHVDAIVSGHTHSLVESIVNNIPIVQARSSGTAVGSIDLPVAPNSNHVAPVITVVDVLTDSVTPDPRIDSIVKRAETAVAPLVNQPVASIAEAMHKTGEQYPLGNLIADAVRVAAKSEIGVMNNGGIRGDLPAGRATYGSAYEVLPIDNRLVSLTVTGAQLKTYLEVNLRQMKNAQPRIHVSGIVVHMDTTAAPDHRITSIAIAGAPLVDAKSYTVAMNDFMTATEPGLTLARGASASTVLDPTLLDAFIDYLKAQPQPVQPPRDTRFVVGQ